MKLNRKTKLFLIGLSPLAVGTFLSFFTWITPLFSLVFGFVFMSLWYKVGSDTIADRKNIIRTMIFLNLPAFIFLVSAFIHENILGSYEGVFGTLTQNYYLSSMFIGTEISDLFRYGVCSFTGNMYEQKLLHADIVFFLLLVGSFALSMIMKHRKKY